MIKNMREENAMLARLFIRLLPVQVAIVAMGSINSIVDGVVASRFIDASTVGVVGLYYTMLRILEAAGSIILGGVTVLSGKYLGSGKIDRTRGVCSLGIAWASIIGAFLTVASFTVPRVIADLLGANADLRDALIIYIRGYAFGLLPQLVGQQIAASLQLERQEKLGQAAIIVMIAVNVVLDILFVAVWNMGVWGLALSTSLANWAYFLVVGQYYFTKKAQLKPSLKLIDWSESGAVIQIGFPNALLVACLAVRSLIINRIMLAYAGSDGLSALSSFNMVLGLIMAVGIGTGFLVRMLTSVFLGEENREGILSLMKLLFTCMMGLMLMLTVIELVLAPVLAGMFFPDTASEVYRMTKELFIVYAFCIPLTLACIAYSNYCQAAGFRKFVTLTAVTDGFFSMVIPAALLAPRMGAMGVWLSYPIGLCITLLVCMLFPILHFRRWPSSLEEWLLLPPEFGSGERLVLHLQSMEDVSRTAETVERFCNDHSLPPRLGNHAGLCLEEMAGNIVRHGFHADRKWHDIELRVVIPDSDVVLRIKDDCIPFNPQEWHEMTTPEDPFANVGIRLVYGIADDIEYQNLLGLNVLTIRLSGDHGAFRQADAE